MVKETEDISPDENNCYECGSLISEKRHFCDKDCSMDFFKRFQNMDDARRELSKITKHRKKNKMPHYKRDKNIIKVGGVFEMDKFEYEKMKEAQKEKSTKKD
ncbi:MAG: hypothetical protein K8I01_12610 [Candidatus Methylomirabilis sp.]|nr:hypothetical protein [Deltaproteobacteria bacterium]